jgi:hypothetical protein
LNGAFVLNREVELPPPIGRIIDTSFTSIDIAASPNLEAINKEVSRSYRDVGFKLKQIIKRTFSNRRKRPPAHGWRLNNEELNKLDKLCSFIVEGCCDSSGLSGQKKLTCYS